MLRKKTISAEEKLKNLLNWGAISNHLTGGNDRIRKNRIPKVHQEEINLLLKYISMWAEGKELLLPSEIEDKIAQIDLKTMILGGK